MIIWEPSPAGLELHQPNFKYLFFVQDTKARMFTLRQVTNLVGIVGRLLLLLEARKT